MAAQQSGRRFLSGARRLAARARRGAATAPRARIDTCWLLTDGSVCVDGWLIEGDGVPAPVEARIVQAARSGAWSPLLRKARPDVVAYVLGEGAVRTDFGLVGRIDGPVDPAKALSVELRGPWGSLRLPVDRLRRDAVPEEVFAGLALDYGALTPAALAPIVGVVRASPTPSPPTASVPYRHAAMTGTAATGIVVPVYRDFAYLRNLLRALADGCPSTELTVVCDDPGLTDELIAWTRSWNDAVYGVPMQVLAHDRNAGFAAACNTGWRSTDSELVLLLNSDVLLDDPPVDLPRLSAGLTSDVAAVAPVLHFPDGTLQHAGMELVEPTDFPEFVLPGHPGKHGPVDDLPASPFDVPMLTGAALCVRRSSLDEVGGVPAVYGRGDFEDVLLSLALRDRGRLVVDPAVRWTHVEGASYHRDRLGGIAVTLAKSVVVGERTGGRR